MAFIAIAYIVMAKRVPRRACALHRQVLCSHGLYSYGLHSYGQAKRVPRRACTLHRRGPAAETLDSHYGLCTRGYTWLCPGLFTCLYTPFMPNLPCACIHVCLCAYACPHVRKTVHIHTHTHMPSGRSHRSLPIQRMCHNYTPSGSRCPNPPSMLYPTVGPK